MSKNVLKEAKFLPWVKRSVVTGLSVPLSVVVVAHDVDVVEVLVHEGDVVGHVDGGGRGADGRSQEELVLVEGGAEIADQVDEVVLVLGKASTLG